MKTSQQSIITLHLRYHHMFLGKHLEDSSTQILYLATGPESQFCLQRFGSPSFNMLDITVRETLNLNARLSFCKIMSQFHEYDY